jgi:hypothetical protein
MTSIIYSMDCAKRACRIRTKSEIGPTRPPLRTCQNRPNDPKRPPDLRSNAAMQRFAGLRIGLGLALIQVPRYRVVS